MENYSWELNGDQIEDPAVLPPGKGAQYPLDPRLSELYSFSGHEDEKKIKFP